MARPGFTATAILSLALGIGANAAMFTLVNDLILRKPSVEEPGRLVEIYMSTSDNAFSTLAYPDLMDVGRGQRTCSAVWPAPGCTWSPAMTAASWSRS